MIDDDKSNECYDLDALRAAVVIPKEHSFFSRRPRERGNFGLSPFPFRALEKGTELHEEARFGHEDDLGHFPSDTMPLTSSAATRLRTLSSIAINQFNT